VEKQYSSLFLALDFNADEHSAGCTVNMSILTLISSSHLINVPIERVETQCFGEGKGTLLMRLSIGVIWQWQMPRDER
jgi:hypothetical protein